MKKIPNLVLKTYRILKAQDLKIKKECKKRSAYRKTFSESELIREVIDGIKF